MSHDCDLLADSLRKEPYAQAVWGALGIAPPPNPQRGDREVFVKVRKTVSPDAQDWLRIEPRTLTKFPRQQLRKDRPHATYELAGKAELHQLLNILVRRYRRPAYADAFNERLRPAFDRDKPGYQLLVQEHGCLDQILFDTNSSLGEELPDSQTYIIAQLVGLLPENSDDKARKQAEAVLAKVESLMRRECKGIDIGEPDSPSRIAVFSREEITLADYEALVAWDWDWLSRYDADQADDTAAAL